MDFKRVFLYLSLLTLMAFFLYNSLGGKQEKSPITVPLNRVADQIKNGEVSKITVRGDELKITRTDGRVIVSRKEQGIGVVELLRDLGVTQDELQSVEIEVAPPNSWVNWLSILGTFLPILFIGGFFYFLARQAQGANSQAFSFGRSRARLFKGDRPQVTFDDVAGVEEAKEDLEEIIQFLKEPEKFSSLGARIPKGVILVGAPGTGKTLLAKAVSGEAGVPFFSISGSEFVEMFVGVGAARVRDLFAQAKRHSPCIVFIDEIDAVGRHRGAGLGGSHDEREQTLNQILVEMDGFDTDTNVIVLAATNRPDILDPALLRPGRFDRWVVLDKPDVKEREAIFRVHVRDKPLDEEVDLRVLARQTPGLVGADIENIVNEAAILAAKEGKKSIGMSEFERAIERVIAGRERKSRIISEEEKRIIAYHEAGHALVMYELPHCDPVHKVSIISRGMALGYTMPLPEEDRYLKTKSKFEDELAGLLGGRVAEEVIFGDVTTGAANDLEQATKLARKMVTRYGMSEKLGPLTFGKKEELVFLGKEIREHRDYSEEIAKEIDQEVRRIVGEAYERAKAIIIAKRDKLDALAEKLIEKETLEEEELEALLSDSSSQAEGT